MILRARSISASLAAVMLLASFAPGVAMAQPAAAPAAGSTAAATAAIAAGDKATRAKDYATALTQYQTAQQTVASSRAEMGVADAFYNLGRLGESYDTYSDVQTSYAGKLGAIEKGLVTKRLKELSTKTGYLSIRVSEAGAEVDVDSKLFGTSPVPTLVRVLTGTHPVHITKAGFTPFDANAEVAADGKAVIDATLAPVATQGHVVVHSWGTDPLRVIVDGVDVGATPWEGDLAPGSHSIAGRSSSSSAEAQTVDIAAGSKTAIDLVASDTAAHVNITTSDGKGVIYLDGVVKGEGTFTGDIAPGPHSVVVSRDGYQRYEKIAHARRSPDLGRDRHAHADRRRATAGRARPSTRTRACTAASVSRACSAWAAWAPRSRPSAPPSARSRAARPTPSAAVPSATSGTPGTPSASSSCSAAWSTPRSRPPRYAATSPRRPPRSCPRRTRRASRRSPSCGIGGVAAIRARAGFQTRLIRGTSPPVPASRTASCRWSATPPPRQLRPRRQVRAQPRRLLLARHHGRRLGAVPPLVHGRHRRRHVLLGRQRQHRRLQLHRSLVEARAGQPGELERRPGPHPHARLHGGERAAGAHRTFPGNAVRSVGTPAQRPGGGGETGGIPWSFGGRRSRIEGSTCRRDSRGCNRRGSASPRRGRRSRRRSRQSRQNSR